jgi:hypothetical protein
LPPFKRDKQFQPGWEHMLCFISRAQIEQYLKAFGALANLKA